MRLFRSPVALLAALALVAGPAALVTAQSPSLSTSAEVPFTGRIQFGPCAGGTTEIVDGVTKIRGDVCQVPILEMSDPRLDGDAVVEADYDTYPDGLTLYRWAFVIENADGVWRQEPTLTVLSADGTYSTATIRLNGEGGYAGLSAVAEVPVSNEIWSLDGFIFEGETPDTIADPSPGPQAFGVPPALPAVGALEAGRYSIANPYAGCEPPRGCSAYRDVAVTLPDGWAVADGLVSKHLGQPGEVAFSIWTVDEVYTDACRWQAGPTVPLDLGAHGHDENGMVFPAGYVNALVAQQGRMASESTQFEQDGRIVLRIELATPGDLDLSTCDGGELRAWTGVAGDANARHAPGQVDLVQMIDFDRRPLVIDASYQPGSTPADRAELDGVLASMTWRW